VLFIILSPFPETEEVVKQLVRLTSLRDLNPGNVGRTWESIKNDVDFKIKFKQLVAAPIWKYPENFPDVNRLLLQGLKSEIVVDEAQVVSTQLGAVTTIRLDMPGVGTRKELKWGPFGSILRTMSGVHLIYYEVNGALADEEFLKSLLVVIGKCPDCRLLMLSGFDIESAVGWHAFNQLFEPTHPLGGYRRVSIQISLPQDRASGIRKPGYSAVVRHALLVSPVAMRPVRPLLVCLLPWCGSLIVYLAHLLAVPPSATLNHLMYFAHDGLPLDERAFRSSALFLYFKKWNVSMIFPKPPAKDEMESLVSMGSEEAKKLLPKVDAMVDHAIKYGLLTNNTDPALSTSEVPDSQESESSALVKAAKDPKQLHIVGGALTRKPGPKAEEHKKAAESKEAEQTLLARAQALKRQRDESEREALANAKKGKGRGGGGKGGKKQTKPEEEPLTFIKEGVDDDDVL
jgi:hypothetical protein